MTDTIYALATPPGRSGVAVIRASGPQAYAGATALARHDLQPRAPRLATLKNPATDEILDRALLLYFKAPASYTGEDIVEYHVHGGRAVIQSLLDSLKIQKGHRMAEPGEFTRRAFENGKMDLTGAEAVADLINAETQAQKIQALAQMDGALSNLYAGWAEGLTKALAHLEADIEFPDEDLDTPDKILNTARAGIEKIAAEIAAHLNDNRRGERLRDGLRVAVMGAPNAGKSSLVNALSQRDVAIVSDLAGTTRDIIEVHLDIAGYPVILADTAGLRPDQLNPATPTSSHDAIESEGIRRALKLAREADIKILLFDAGESTPDTATLNLLDENSILVINKTDIPHLSLSLQSLPPARTRGEGQREKAVQISARTGEGIDTLLTVLAEKIKSTLGSAESASLTRARHRTALEDTQACLTRADQARLPELMAEDMRLALRALGRITGRVDVEDLFDVIFRDFCIGK